MRKILAIVSLLWISLPLLGQASGAAAGNGDRPNGYVRLRTESPQLEFPLQTVGAVFNYTELQLLFVNVTSRVIEQVNVAVLLKDEAAPEPVTRKGNACTTSLPPGGFLLVRTKNTGFDAAMEYYDAKKIAAKVVSVGVTHVRFAGGMEWNYPVEAKSRFEGERNEDVDKKVEALKEKAFGPGDSGRVFFDPSLEGKFSVCRQ